MERSYRETGTVLFTDGAWATVKTDKSSACDECGKARAGICGKKGHGMVFRVLNPLNAAEGDTVELGFRTRTVALGYFFFFVFPLLALFAGIYAGGLINAYFSINSMDVKAGFAGLVLAILYAVKKIQALNRSDQLSVTRIMSVPAEGHASASAEEVDYLRVFGGNNL